MRRLKIKEERLKRNNRLTLMLNNREMRALDIYCQRYRIKNRARFLRETIMMAIIQRFNDQAPTLWEDSEPDLFSSDIRSSDLKYRR